MTGDKVIRIDHKRLGLILLICLAGLAGCRPEGRPVAAAGPIVKLQLLTAPAALNLDDKPGPDGIAAQVYALDEKGDKGVPIRAGRLSLLIFEHTPTVEQMATATPWREWSFEPKELTARGRESFAGIGYSFVLAWEKVPASPKITLAARYEEPGGKTIYSAPISILIHSE